MGPGFVCQRCKPGKVHIVVLLPLQRAARQAGADPVRHYNVHAPGQPQDLVPVMVHLQRWLRICSCLAKTATCMMTAYGPQVGRGTCRKSVKCSSLPASLSVACCADKSLSATMCVAPGHTSSATSAPAAAALWVHLLR